jgi:hypothetical protein
MLLWPEVWEETFPSQLNPFSLEIFLGNTLPRKFIMQGLADRQTLGFHSRKLFPGSITFLGIFFPISEPALSDTGSVETLGEGPCQHSVHMDPSPLS